ncbi:hypothetical protein ACHAQA_005888 [Verticillium albo-atrum]
MGDSFDRGGFVTAFTGYYTLLASSGLFPPEAIKQAPRGGWPLTALSIPPNRSEAAIALLSKIPYLEPYIGPDGSSSQWPIFGNTRAVSYLAPLPEDYPSLPPDTILLARGSITGTKDCILDCATGEVTTDGDDDGPGIEFFEAQADALRDQTVMPLPPVDDLGPELYVDRWGGDDPVKRDLKGISTKCGWTGTYNVLVWNRPRFLREMAWFRRTRRQIEDSKAVREALYDDEADEEWKLSEDEMELDGSDGSNSDSDAETDIDEVAAEIADVWADLNEPEFTHASEQLAKDSIPHGFKRPKKRHVPARLAVPPGPPPPSAAAIRDALIDGLTRYYTLLTRAAYFPADVVEYPAPGGWQAPDFPEEKLRALKYSDQVIDVLRHLPYIREGEGDGPDGEDVRWQAFVNGFPIRYLSDGDLLQNESAKKLAKKKLESLGLSPYEKPLPNSMFALVKAREEWQRHWWIVDLEKGEIMVDDGSHHSNGDTPKKTPWLRNIPVPIADFFDTLVLRLVTLDLVPVPDLGRLEGMWEDDVYGPEIWGGISTKESDNVRGGMDLEIELARDVYIEHGWPTLDFRREECIDALVKMRQKRWRQVREESKKLFNVECADGKDEDEEDDDEDMGME